MDSSSMNHLIINNNSIRSTSPAIVIVIMGVSGSGKSTIGKMLADTMDGCFLDADDFHPQLSKEKMGKGLPLTEEDRVPWLETLHKTLRENLGNGKKTILGCSALKKRYRDVLRLADYDYEPGSYVGRVKFVCLNAPTEVIAARLEKRAEEGRHFMHPTLLQSQLDLLKIDDAEGISIVDATLIPEAIVNNIKTSIIDCGDWY